MFPAFLGPEIAELFRTAFHPGRNRIPRQAQPHGQAVQKNPGKQVLHPGYDSCELPLKSETSFDLVVADQVFDHLLWPSRPARNVLQMPTPGG